MTLEEGSLNEAIQRAIHLQLLLLLHVVVHTRRAATAQVISQLDDRVPHSGSRSSTGDGLSASLISTRKELRGAAVAMEHIPPVGQGGVPGCFGLIHVGETQNKGP